MPKNVLVIGGSYFIGRAFVEEAASREGFALTTANRGSRPPQPGGLRHLACDRHDPESLARTLAREPWHAIVDFCAYTPADVKNLFSALPKAWDGHYIYLSSAGVYAPSHHFPVQENAPKISTPQPHLGPAARYGLDKWLAEYQARALCMKNGLAFTAIRPTMVYGPHNYAPRESYFYQQIQERRPLFLPDPDLALFSLVYVKDVARALWLCVENPSPRDRAFNLAGPELLNYARYYQLLEQLAQRKLYIEKANHGRINRQGVPLPFSFDEHMLFDGSAFCREMGFEYTALETGMEKTWDWLLEQHRNQAEGGPRHE